MENKTKYIMIILSMFLSIFIILPISNAQSYYVDVKVITNISNVAVPNNNPGTTICSITFTPISATNEFTISGVVTMAPTGTGYMILGLTDATLTPLSINSTNIYSTAHYTGLAPSSAALLWAGIFPQQNITIYLGVATVGSGGNVLAGSAQMVITEYSRSLPPNGYYDYQMDFTLYILIFIVLITLLGYNVYCLRIKNKIFLSINLTGSLLTEGVLFTIYPFMTVVHIGIILFHVFMIGINMYVNLQGIILDKRELER